jgi:hypothetical protein
MNAATRRSGEDALRPRAFTRGRRRKEPWIERDDVTSAILYVESDAGRFATRTTISVDLGLRAK